MLYSTTYPCAHFWNGVQETKSHDKVDMFMLITQVVVARGIHLFVKLAESEQGAIASAAVSTLKRLTATSWRLKSLLQRATRDEGLLTAITAGEQKRNHSYFCTAFAYFMLLLFAISSGAASIGFSQVLVEICSYFAKSLTSGLCVIATWKR